MRYKYFDFTNEEKNVIVELEKISKNNKYKKHEENYLFGLCVKYCVFNTYVFCICHIILIIYI